MPDAPTVDENELFSLRVAFPESHLSEERIAAALNSVCKLGTMPEIRTAMIGATGYSLREIENLKPKQPRSQMQTHMLHWLHALLMVGSMVEAVIETKEETDDE